ncbi:MAG: FAD-dependent oxidoreductase [Actinobacteria bacterium]|nr:FAD-dependent oxidoreductase [Actinomycetota bacterium]
MGAVPPRIAVVGAGPAGAFAAASVWRMRPDAQVDFFERLPTAWGLLRAGVAPDHQEIKRLDDTFDRETLRRGCRFFGNVEVGVDVSHADLMRHYTAVIYATGAQTDKSIGIPGEDLPGSWAATEFVAWYNGHPDYRGLEFDLSGRRAVVIGNGNVAADVTRILMRSPEELERTDVADHALEALRESRIEEVVVLGRRGPAQAAFTSAELRELGYIDGVDVQVDSAEAELDKVSHEWLAEEGTFTARRNVALVREYASGTGAGTGADAVSGAAQRRIVLRFLRSPAAIRGTGRVEAVDIRRNELVRTDDGALRARPAGDEVETIECGLVLRSVGYQAVPLPDVPFDERSYVLPNDRGRVLLPDGEPLAGVYAVGWIKRGPTGILGTNKRDAAETVRCLVDDLAAGRLPEPASVDGDGGIEAVLADRKPDLVTAEGWHAIDVLERERGSRDGRPRAKLTSREELLDAARAATVAG